MVHGAHGVGGGIDGHFHRVRHELTNEMPDVSVESGREQHGLIATRAAAEHPFDLRGETVVGHAVGLVEHHHFHGGQVDLVGLQEVDQSKRRGHHDLDALGHGLHLLVATGSAVHGQNPSIGVTGQRFEDLGHLHREFASGDEHQTERTHGFGLGRDARQHGHAEGERLAGAGLGAAAHVVTLQRHRNGFDLNGERIGEAARGQTGVDFGRNSETSESGGGLDGRKGVDGCEWLRGAGNFFLSGWARRTASTPWRTLSGGGFSHVGRQGIPCDRQRCVRWPPMCPHVVLFRPCACP